MSRSISSRTIATTLAAGLVASVSTGITYAATRGAGSTVKACVNKQHVLALRTSSGACPAGFSATTINKQGVRGARGPVGRTGAPGPGKHVLFVTTDGSVARTRTVSLGGFTIRATCSKNDASGGFGEVEMSPVAASDYRIDGSAEVVQASGGTAGVNDAQGGNVLPAGHNGIAAQPTGHYHLSAAYVGANDFARATAHLLVHDLSHVVALDVSLVRRADECQVTLQVV